MEIANNKGSVKMKLQGIFNMSFGKTFFVGEVMDNEFITGSSIWDIYVNNVYLKTIEFESENLLLKRQEHASRSFSYDGIFDKSTLNYDRDDIMLILKWASSERK